MRKLAAGVFATAIATSALMLATSAAQATTADAATASAAASTADYLTATWGPFYSRYLNGGRAKTAGRVWPDAENGSFNFEARVYDQSPSLRMCGYIQVKFVNHEGAQPAPRSARKCGPLGFGRVTFSGWEEDVPSAYLVQVCVWDSKLGVKRSCGKWTYAYRFQTQD
jgi:hypothetical protein